MATVQDLHTELEESVDLTGQVISDVNILSNIVFPIKTTIDLAVLFEAKSNLLFNYLDTTEKALLIASKLPIVGGPLGAIRFAGKHFNESLQNVSDTLSVIDKPLDIADKALLPVSVALPTAGLTANAALLVNSDRIDVLDNLQSLGVVTDGSNLTGSTQENYDQLVQANEITRDVTDATAPMRDALGVLDFSAFSLLADGLSAANEGLDQTLKVFEPFSDALDKLNDAIKPVEWALDAASSVVDQVVNPVIGAVLDATGLNDMIQTLSDQIFGNIGVLDDLKGMVAHVRAELDQNDVAGLVNNFWGGFSDLFDVGGGIDLANTIGQLEIDTDGSISVIGTNGDDELIGTDGDDNFAPLAGNDVVRGLGGTDRVHFLDSIEQYRVDILPGGDLQVAARDPAIASEGTDRLEDVELLRFNTAGTGDITLDDIARFQYTAPGAPNLTGDGDINWLFGDASANQLDGGGGDDRLFGGGGDDRLSGGAGDDVIYGQGGNDAIQTGDGDDLVFAGDGNDDILVFNFGATTGADTIFGGAGTDALTIFGDQSVTVDFDTGAVDYGAAGMGYFSGIELLQTGTGNDTFLAADGAQTMISDGGHNSFLYVGDGDRVYQSNFNPGQGLVSFLGGGYLGVRVEVNESDGAYDTETTAHDLPSYDPHHHPDPSIFGVQAFEGTHLSDAFYALGVTQGNIGSTPEFTYTNDAGEQFTLDGSVFLGGAGSDVFFASETSSYFDGGSGFDLVNFNLDYTIAERLSDSGIQRYDINLETGLAQRISAGRGEPIHLRGIEGVVGTRGTDVITGDDNANFLSGYLGHDTIHGGGGSDYIDGSGLTAPELFGDAGDDVIAVGSATEATVDGGAGTDALELRPDEGFRLDAFLDNEAWGSEAPSLVNVAGWQVDLAAGTATSKYYTSTNLGSNVPYTETSTLRSIENVLGSDLADTISGDDGVNLLVGRGGDDVLDGRGGDDALQGGAGGDMLVGGAGDDLLDGGDGLDLILGGDGNDMVQVTSGDVAEGGAGDDTFTAYAPRLGVLDGSGAPQPPISVVGGEEDETDGDTLIVDDSAVVKMTGAESGTVTWQDGTTLTFSEIEHVSVVPCFTPGTRVFTRHGYRPVEEIAVGDAVMTRDRGFQRVRWVGRRDLDAADLAARPRLRPVRIPRGALGRGRPSRDLVVSPQHRVLLADPALHLATGHAEALAPAVHLLGRGGIGQDDACSETSYIHLLFDAHELVLSDGAWTESFHPGRATLDAMPDPQRKELLALFPELGQATCPTAPPSARTTLKRHETAIWQPPA